jgi:hypothetical protein
VIYASNSYRLFRHRLSSTPLSHTRGVTKRRPRQSTSMDSLSRIKPNLWACLYTLRQSWQYIWADAVCIYSYRTVMKHLRILRFAPLFSGGFNLPYRRGRGGLIWPPGDRAKPASQQTTQKSLREPGDSLPLRCCLKLPPISHSHCTRTRTWSKCLKAKLLGEYLDYSRTKNLIATHGFDRRGERRPL